MRSSLRRQVCGGGCQRRIVLRRVGQNAAIVEKRQRYEEVPEQCAFHLDQRQDPSRLPIVLRHQIPASMTESAQQDVPPFKRVIQGSVWRALYVGLPLCLAPRIRQFDDFEVLHLVLSSESFGPFGIGSPGRGCRRDKPRCSTSFASAVELTLACILHA